MGERRDENWFVQRIVEGEWECQFLRWAQGFIVKFGGGGVWGVGLGCGFWGCGFWDVDLSGIVQRGDV